MQARLLVIALFSFISEVRGQTLPPGIYAGNFWNLDREIQIIVKTNGVIDIGLLRLNPFTGGAVRGSLFGTATNRPNGVIIGRFPGRGSLRGHVVLGETNTVRGTLVIWSKDGEHPVARHFRAADVWAGFAGSEMFIDSPNTFR
jgi:hypothetical protein